MKPIVPLLLLCGVGCGVLRDAPSLALGSFQVRFHWAVPKPGYDAGLFVFGRVEDRTHADHPEVLATAGPVPFNADNDPPRLQFDGVSNGEHRVVVVEYRPGNTSAAPVFYHGVSPEFAPGLGRNRTLVDVDLVARPNLLAPALPPAVRVVRHGEDGFANRALVTLQVFSDTGVQVQVANVLSALDSAPRIELGTLPAASSNSSVREWVDWNLDADAAQPCVESDHCERVVFVRFWDQHSYPSDAFSAPVILDTRDPSLLSLTGNWPVPRGAPLVLNVLWSEPLASTGLPGLTITGASGNAVDWPLVPSTSASTSATYIVPETLLSDGVYTVTVTLLDRAGRPREIPQAASIVIDTVVPEGRNIAFSGSGVVTDDAQLEVTLSTSEPCTVVQVAMVTHEHSVLFDVASVTPPAVPGMGSSYVFRHTVGLADAEGLHELVLSLVDNAWNRSEPANIRFVEVDRSAPAVTSATVTYAPALDNPLARPTKARAGSSIIVSVIADEVVDASAPPALTLSGTGLPRTVGTLDTDGRGVVFVVVVPQGIPDGIYAPHIEWRDPAHNATSMATFAPPVVELDSTAPVLTIQQSEFLYVRRPAGSPVLETIDGFSFPPGAYFGLHRRSALAATVFPGATVTTNEGAPLQLRIWDALNQGNLLGSAAVHPDGSFLATRLANVDVPAVYVSASDAAGNESPRVRVQYSEWMATPAPQGRRTPHPLALTHHANASRVGTVMVPVDGALGAGRDGVMVDAESEPLGEFRRESGAVDLSRYLHAAAFDLARNRMVLAGGRTLSVVYDDTWELEGDRWDVTSGMGPRWGLGMAYDQARGRVVAFGGVDGLGNLPDNTLEWDGLRWTAVQPKGASPPVRTGHCMAYDPVRATTLVFGGEGTSGPLGDLWSWDGDAWTLQPGGGTAPAPRSHMGCAYDERRSRLVVFGGQDGPVIFFSTWEWDGAQWHDVSLPAGQSPSARRTPSMVFDARRGHTLLFGGRDFSTDFRNDTWRWNGSNWQQLFPSGPLPPPRGATPLVYDRVTERAFLVGGQMVDQDGDPLALPEIWVWDGFSWKEINTYHPVLVEPAARVYGAAAYDVDRANMVLFGGYNFGTYNDTWTWDGYSWRPAIGLLTAPSTRLGHGMVYVEDRHTTLLFGGKPGFLAAANQDAWEWNGTQWSPVTQSGPVPPGRAVFGFAYHAARSQVVMFGGEGSAGLLADTWLWTNGEWMEWTPQGSRPSGRAAPGMTYDPVRQRTVMFGGLAGSTSWLNDLWEWNGDSWSLQTPLGDVPAPVAASVMVFDESLGMVVLHSGIEVGAVRSDRTWTYDGMTWRSVDVTSAAPVTPRDGAAAAYDRRRKTTVVFGGNRANPIASTFEMNWTNRVPAIQWNVALEEAAVDLSQVDSLSVTATCGGTAPGGQPGAVLMGWGTRSNSGTAPGWQQLAQPGASGNGDLTFYAATNSDARRLIVTRDNAITVQCRPRVGTAVNVNESSVSADAFLLRLRYSHPD